MSFNETLKEDPVGKKYRNTIRMTQEKANLEKVRAEVLGLHATRPSRVFWKHKMNPSKLNEAVLIDLSNRARMVELRTDLYVQLEVIDRAIVSFKEHLLTEYREEIKDRTSNAEERNAFVRRLLSRGYDLKSQYEVLVTIIDKLIEDVDKAGYALTSVREMLKVQLERPGQVV